jgi:2-aminoethylphosphonate-pyruvate transaminase
MGISTAVIMAAGMGTRLGELGRMAPKGFIRLGERPIIEESIERLGRCGVERIVIVTGHLADYYERLREGYGGRVVTVHNPLYAESGSMYSLACARELVEGDFLLLESDLIYERRALEAALAFPKDNVVLLSDRTDAGDEVYVGVSGETIVSMSKRKAELRGEMAGELVGVSKISMPLFRVMLEKAAGMFRESLMVAYETDALVAAAEDYPVYYTLVPGLLWAEIDDEQHLLRARQKIYPALGPSPR